MALVVVPVILTGLFTLLNTRQNNRHEREAQARQLQNSSEHNSVMDALNNLTTAFQEHLSWHLDDNKERETTS